MKTDQYLPEVREQYESFPYPPRDPADERERMITTWLDDLSMINHYCFAGRQGFQDNFRVLIAGGGTGDGTIFLAEQLRTTNAEIVHVDLSQASIAIARERARARGLENITWVNESLLALPELGLGQFDYINCSGVLHHLADPDAGLRALLPLRKESGALGIMVYATYGRTGVYQMQSLLRLVNQQQPDIQDKLDNARQILESIPPSNWFNRGRDLYHDHALFGDAGIYDLLLHAQDRAYTVGELYDWLHDRHGLHLEFTYPNRGASIYQAEMIIGPRQPGFLNAIKKLPLRQQQEIGELLGGNVIMHSFFATQAPTTKAPYGDPDSVPFFCHEPVTGADLSQLVEAHQEQPFVLQHTHTGISVLVDPGKFGKTILKHMDGQRTFGEIFSLVRADPKFREAPPSDETLFEDFRAFFEVLGAIDRLLLRHRSVKQMNRYGGSQETQNNPLIS